MRTGITRLLPLVILLTVRPAGAQGQSAAFDPKAVALLRQVERATRAVKAMRGVAVVARVNGATRDRLTGPFLLARPNLAKVLLEGRQGQTVASDGSQVWVLNASSNQFIKRKAGADGRDLAQTLAPLIPLAMFYDPAILTAKTPQGAAMGRDSPVTRNGARYDVVALIAPGIEIRLFISREKLVQRAVTTSTRGGQSAAIDTELINLQLNTTISKRAFTYGPPKTGREHPGPVRVQVAPAK